MGTGHSKRRKPKRSALDVGNYSLRHLIGRGSFSEVRMAVHKPTCADVAAKIITKAKLKPQDQKRVQIERDAHSQLSHPHIVKLLDVIETETHLYMFMELATCNMASYFGRVGKIKESKCKLPFFQLISAVQHAHSKGFVHRDIKLENIYMTSHGVVLGDWGLASPWNKSTRRRSSVGTPAYCSPEIVNELEYYGPEVDVWSLGVVLYRLIAGVFPFDGANIQENITNGTFEMPPDSSPEVQKLLRSMLEPNAGKRATIDEVLSSEWLSDVKQDDLGSMPQIPSMNGLLGSRPSLDDESGDEDESEDSDDEEDEEDEDDRLSFATTPNRSISTPTRRSTKNASTGSKGNSRGGSKGPSKGTSFSNAGRDAIVRAKDSPREEEPTAVRRPTSPRTVIAAN